MVKDITSLEEFQQLINSGKKIAIDFWAEWCGPCRFVSPVFEKLEAQYPDIEFIKVDVDNAAEISQEIGIKAMPTFIAFHNGFKVDEVIGANSQALQALLERFASS
ncbi:MAG: thioredoxin [Benniella sp.]|nr:MAG: thioredoxin [Benniella sp.]